jgi:hypothetical protein
MTWLRLLGGVGSYVLSHLWFFIMLSVLAAIPFFGIAWIGKLLELLGGTFAMVLELIGSA